MSLSKFATALQRAQFAAGWFDEYINGSPLSKLYGTDTNSVIQLVEELTKTPGRLVSVRLLAALKGGGAEGTATLEGAEDKQENYAHQITCSTLRNAVAVTDEDADECEIDLLKSAGPALKQWFANKDHQKLIDVLSSATTANGYTKYADCSETVKDAWLVLNSDRCLFGAAQSNNAANDHSACLTTLDATNDKFTYTNLSFGRRVLEAADPLIRPYDMGDKGNVYIALTGIEAFRDLKSSLATIHADAEVRGRDNPLFNDGDLFWDGMIIKKDPLIKRIADVGDSATVDVMPVYYLGAQALGFAWKRRPRATRSVRDYEFINGVGLDGSRGIEKLYFNSKQHGVFTHWVAAQPDA